jgi:rubredoxin
MCRRNLAFSPFPVATIRPHCSEATRISVSEPRTWMCLICGWIYDEATGDPEHGIAAGTAWADIPMNWTCPECGARKEDFEMVQI